MLMYLENYEYAAHQNCCVVFLNTT